MRDDLPHQTLNPTRTTWHITWGTYGARLHGGFRPTVDRDHNEHGTPFLPRDPERERAEAAILNFPPVILTREQRKFIEAELPAICDRGDWSLRTCSGGGDHVHLLCDVLPAIHGEKVRRLAKRWLGQEMSKRWPLPEGATWWAEEGSNIAIHDEAYLNNAFGYIFRQRATGRSGG
jgi:REP element-mobilizing transposase RayT